MEGGINERERGVGVEVKKKRERKSERKRMWELSCVTELLSSCYYG